MNGTSKIFASLLAGTILALLFACGLSFAAHFVPRAPVFENARVSIPLMSNFRRADTFTECLVIGAAALPDKNVLEGIFGFNTLKGRPSDPTIPHDHETCAGLRAYLGGESAAQIGTEPYTRYWNGPVSLARFALSVSPFLYAYIAYGLVGVLAFSLWGWSLAQRGLTPRAAGLIALACFYGSGLPYVVGNLAHTPAYALPILFIAIATLKSSWWKQKHETICLAACVGGLTFYFDMLFMAIPFNALFFGTTWLLLKGTERSKATAKDNKTATLLMLLAAYGFSGAVMLGFKVIMIALLSNTSAVFSDFFHQLFWRMSYEGAQGEHFTFARLIFENLPLAATKMFFHPIVCFVLYIVGLGFFVQAFRQNAQATLPFALLATIVPVWYMIFTNHSWIHGTFAMRILFWPPLLSVLAWRSSSLPNKAHAQPQAR